MTNVQDPNWISGYEAGYECGQRDAEKKVPTLDPARRREAHRVSNETPFAEIVEGTSVTPVNLAQPTAQEEERAFEEYANDHEHRHSCRLAFTQGYRRGFEEGKKRLREKIRGLYGGSAAKERDALRAEVERLRTALRERGGDG